MAIEVKELFLKKMVVICINPLPNESGYLTLKHAELLVYRGQAAFFEDPIDHQRKLRYLEHYEQMRLRAEIVNAMENAFDDALIDNGRRVVFWNGSADPKSRHIPGIVRS